jgi:hypothetical protein
MASVTQTVSNYLGGVSKQVDNKKLPGQLRECLNALPDPTFGLMKRPGLKFEKQLTTSNLDGAKWFYIHRDGDEKYIGRIKAATVDSNGTVTSNGDIAIWNAATGVACSVNNVAEYQHAYLNTNRENYHVLTVQDTTFITNKTQVVTTEAAPSYTINTVGTVHLKMVSYGERYEILINGVKSPDFITRRGENAASWSDTTQKLSGKDILDQLKTNVEAMVLDGEVDITQLNSSLELAYAVRPIAIGTETDVTGTGVYTDLDTVITIAGQIITIDTISAADTGRTEGSYTIGASDYTTAPPSDPDTGLPYPSGTGATFTVDIDDVGAATVKVTESGSGFHEDEVITITDEKLGGSNTGGSSYASNLTFNVNELKSGLKVEVDVKDGAVQSIIPKERGIGYETNDVVTIAIPDISATASVTGTLGELVPTAFTLEVNDDKGNVNLDCFQEDTTTVSDIPYESVENRYLKIVNTAAAEDSYWLRFYPDSGTSGPGKWEESRAPNISPGLIDSTMPHELFNSGPNAFEFKPIEWNGRISGDDVTNSDPSFVGNTIQQAFFHNNRLGFLTEDNVSMSQSGDVYNFYFTSALTSTDLDPIDLSCASIRPAKLHSVIPTAQGLILFSAKQQFIMFSDTEILTPASSVIRGISNYEMDPIIDPVDVGTSIAFVSKTPSYTRVYGATTRGSQENPLIFDVGKVVSEWIPKDVTELIASPQNSMIALYGDSSNLMYLYKTYQVDEKNLMQAWFKWKLPGDIQFSTIDTDYMYSVVKNGNNYDLLKASLTQTPDEEILITSDGKQVNPHMDYYATPTSVKYKEVTALNLDPLSTLTGYTGTPTVTISAPIIPISGRGVKGEQATAEVVVDSNNTITGLTITDPGSGYEAPPTVTIIADTGGSGATATAEINQDEFSRCYLPYPDITTLTPVLVIAGGGEWGDIIDSGFTISPERGVDTNGDEYFKVPRRNLAWHDGNYSNIPPVVVGYKYNFEAELPKTYYKTDDAGEMSDYTANLTVARMKFSVGLSSVVGFKLKRKGYIGPSTEFVGDGTNTYNLPFELDEEEGIVVKIDGWKTSDYIITPRLDSDNNSIPGQSKITLTSGNLSNNEKLLVTTDTWYDIQPVQEAGEYLADDVPLTEDNIFTIPIHQRNDNFELKIFSNSPFPISINSSMWEGNYSPKFYTRR